MNITKSNIRAKIKGRTVVITGADGFVGSHLTEQALHYGADVHVIVRPASSGMLHNIAGIARSITIHKADITDIQAVRQAFLKIKKNGTKQPIIIHLAAQAHVGESWDRPYETLITNIIGTTNILQTIVDTHLHPYKVSFAGSSEEYGNVNPEVKSHYIFSSSGGLILNEQSPVYPQSIYAVSKLAGDFLFRNFYKAYNIPCVVARKFNNYGPRQNPRFVTATIITQALERKTIHLGYLGAKRDFTFVKDGARGHLHVALYGKPGSVYCFGSGRTISIKEWVDLILSIGKKHNIWGNHTITCQKIRGRLGASEVEELRVDYSKLHLLTGWKPLYTWEKGILETIVWYKNNRNAWIGRIDW